MPGRLITTASADVTLKGLRVPARGDGQAAHRARRTPDGDRPAKPEGGRPRAIERLGLADAVTFVSGVPDERIVELYAEAELAVVPSLYEGFSLPAVEAMATGDLPGRHHRRRAARGHRAATARPCSACPPGDAEALAATHRAAGSTTPTCGPASAPPAGGGSIERWSWRHCAQLTVDQYREVLAMPRPKPAPDAAT